MKLSEAIRLGAMALPPVHGPIIKWNVTNGTWTPCGACLLGAALFAIEESITWERYHADMAGLERVESILTARYPWVAQQVEDPRYPGYASGGVLSIAMQCFEFGEWSRERVADWIASIEPSEDIERAQEWQGVAAGDVVPTTV